MVYYPIKMFVIDFDLPEIVFFLRRTTHCPPQTACLSFIKLLTCHLDLLRVLEVLHLHRGRRVRDRMVIGFTTTYAISAYHH